MKLKDFICNTFIPLAMGKYRRSQTEISRINQFVGYTQTAGRSLLSDISPTDIRTFLGELKVADSTKNRYRAVISAAFSLAYELGLVQQNPVRATRALPENNIRDRVLSKKEVAEFIKAAEEDDNFVQSAALLIALYTGLRMGNVISMQWSWFSTDRQSILIPRTKSGRPQRVYLNQPAKDVFNKLRTLGLSTEFVFPSYRSDRDYISYPRACLERIQQKMQLAGSYNGHFSMHDLRRTYASYQLSATSDIRAVQQSLGHSCITTTERYAHHQPDRLAQVSQSTFDHMTGAN